MKECTSKTCPRKPYTLTPCPYCSTPISPYDSNGNWMRKSKYEQRKTCGGSACRSAAAMTKPRRCEGCNVILKPNKGEARSSFLRRKGCLKPECRDAIKEKVMLNSRIKKAHWYYKEPDLLERFCRGMV